MSGPRRELPYVTIAAVVPCPAGWLSVSARIVGVTVVVEEPRSYASFVEVLDHRPRFSTIALASPVGFPDEPTGGYRRADEAARAHLPWKLRVTVPRVPCKEALYAPSLEAAQVIEPWVTLAEYRRFFQWREVDSELQPFHQRTVFSGLPELSYGLLAGEGGLKTTPNTPEGQRDRIDLIDKRIPGVRTAVEIAPPVSESSPAAAR